MSEEVRLPWERRPREPTKSHELFREYRDLGPARSIITIADKHGRSRAGMQNLAGRWDWAARAAAWDDHVRMTDDRERIAAIRDMHKRHREIAVQLMYRGLRHLERLEEQPPSAAGAARLVELGLKLERDLLTTSVEELEGVLPMQVHDDDPWEALTRELIGDTD